MNEAIRQMLSAYEIKSLEDSLRAHREIMQEIALLGLWRGKFFEKAAFYGGTALRVLYGHDRFSEDLDFSLLAQRIEKVNIEQIKQEMEPFVKDLASLAVWSKDFFLDVASRIKLI